VSLTKFSKNLCEVILAFLALAFVALSFLAFSAPTKRTRLSDPHQRDYSPKDGERSTENGYRFFVIRTPLGLLFVMVADSI